MKMVVLLSLTAVLFGATGAYAYADKQLQVTRLKALNQDGKKIIQKYGIQG